MENLLALSSALTAEAALYDFDDPVPRASLSPGERPRVLNEEEEISINLSLPQSYKFLDKMAAGNDSVYVFDTVGRKNCATCSILNKLKRNFKEN